jgi:hypothetical protein
MPTDNLIRSDNFGLRFNLDANIAMTIRRKGEGTEVIIP